ncbi:ETC complex I subunit [Camelimonas abortus]|uniref:ETC complex I subunit n=1 Tax=Camelimonas abortus TaxID=1017184 RepID=A0ABV7LE19_9HYPH
MTARILQPARNVMQSGKAKSRRWLLAFDPASPREVEPLMGWTSSADTRQQLRLWFDTREEAVAFAERNGIPYRVEEPRPSRPRRHVSYSDNFRPDRLAPWTH